MTAFGHNAYSMAKHYGFNYQSLVTKLASFDIPRLDPTERAEVISARRVEIPIAEAIQLSNEGVTYSDLAKKYGVTSGIVMRRMQEAGHEAPRSKMRRNAPGRTLTPAKWKLLQTLKAERGGCEVCGEVHVLDLAHIKPNRHGGNLEEDNTLLLCPNEHRLFDSGKLSQDQFLKIKARVRKAEELFDFKLPFYGDW
jgi:transposase-like protein